METSTQRKLEELRAYLCEVSDLQSAGALLAWDQATYMPEAGAPARVRQMAALEELSLIHISEPTRPY